jgi:hypothetical protein
MDRVVHTCSQVSPGALFSEELRDLRDLRCGGGGVIEQATERHEAQT